MRKAAFILFLKGGRRDRGNRKRREGEEGRKGERSAYIYPPIYKSKEASKTNLTTRNIESDRSRPSLWPYI